jgi:hypothetical protein
MNYYTADDHEGVTQLAVAGHITRQQFIDAALIEAHELSDMHDGHTRDLELREWNTEHDWRCWASGRSTDFAEDDTWVTVGRRSQILGEIRYCWPGEYLWLKPGEREPQPGAAWMATNAPVGYEGGDGLDPAEQPGYHDLMAGIWDNRDKTMGA